MRFLVVDKDHDAKANELKLRVPMKYGKWQQDIIR